MTQTEFEEIYEKQTAHEREVLIDRASAYATHGDRLGNFYAGAELNEVTPLQFAFGLMTKHILALRDLIQKQAEGVPLDDAVMARAREYGGDIRNYVLLALAIFEETMREQQSITVLLEGSDGEPERCCLHHGRGCT